MQDERIATLALEALEPPALECATGGAYLVHYFWTDERGRERHEAGQYGDKGDGLSEIEECLGSLEAARLRNLRPGQSATWEGRYHGSRKRILANRIW
jgi:hypothetical protein